jgi:hypothetical protein
MSASSQSTVRREATTSRPRYRQQPIDQNVPPIPVSRLLSIPSTRPGRSFRQQPIDPHPTKFYGDTAIQKSPGTTRVFFQNVKGLTHTPSQEDYRYYMSCLQGLNIDIAGLAETNACWAPRTPPHRLPIIRSQILPTKQSRLWLSISNSRPLSNI